MKAENITAQVNRAEKEETEKMQRAMQHLRTLLSSRVSEEIMLDTHGQIIQAISMVLFPGKQVPPLVEPRPGAGWYVRSQFSQALRTLLGIRDTRWTLGDILAELDKRLATAPTGSHNLRSHPQSRPGFQ